MNFATLTVEPRVREADLTIAMKAVDFESMMDGSLDVALAIQSGDLVFSGDGELFENLAAFTKPLQSRTDGEDAHAS